MRLDRDNLVSAELLDAFDEFLQRFELVRLDVKDDEDDVDLVLDEVLGDLRHIRSRRVLLDDFRRQANDPPAIAKPELHLVGLRLMCQHCVVLVHAQRLIDDRVWRGCLAQLLEVLRVVRVAGV